MPAHALCQQLADLDFGNPDHLRRILGQDKHTRIEGLCSELAFEQDVLRGNLAPVTGNFWFTRHGATYAVSRICASPEAQLQELDYQLLDGFCKVPDVPVRLVYFDGVRREFRELVHRSGQRYPASLSGLGERLLPGGGQQLADPSERDEARLRKACDYLAAHGQLYDMAVHRLFANCWLRGGVWDVDAFARTPQGKVVALEVKQKYPTAGGTFGLNEGQHNLFRFLTSVGIPVVHVVLEKPPGSISVSAVDLLTQEVYTRHTRWLYTRFLPNKYRQAVQAAPAFTSIYGGQVLGYRHIPVSQFGVLKMFGGADADVRAKLLAGLA